MMPASIDVATKIKKLGGDVTDVEMGDNSSRNEDNARNEGRQSDTAAGSTRTDASQSNDTVTAADRITRLVSLVPLPSTLGELNIRA